MKNGYVKMSEIEQLKETIKEAQSSVLLIGARMIENEGNVILSDGSHLMESIKKIIDCLDKCDNFIDEKDE